MPEPEEEIQEDTPEESESEPESSGGSFGALGMIMLLFACLIDLVSFIFVFVGWDFGVSTILGVSVIWPLMLASSGRITKNPGEDITSKIMKKVGLASLIELIPVLGNISPTWTITVFMHLKKR